MRFLSLNKLSEPTLNILAGSLKEGRLSVNLSESDLRSICGSNWQEVWTDLIKAHEAGFSLAQLGILVGAVYEARISEPDPDRLFELILTGPHMRGAEVTSTQTIFYRMVEQAQSELILAGYAIYNGKELFKSLASKMHSNPNLKVTFCLNIERRQHDTTTNDGIINEYIRNFKKYNWPEGCRLPEIYYFPDALSATDKAVLHSKCVIADGREALVTSANFTGSAQIKNLEAGVLVKEALMVKRLRTYFLSAIESNLLQKLYIT